MSHARDEAFIFDVLHTPGTAAEVNGLQAIAKQHVQNRNRIGTWLEPACGTGRYLRVAASQGLRVVGFDRSDAMRDFARKSFSHVGPGASRARLFVAEMESFAARMGKMRVDFAFNLHNTLRLLETDAQVLAHLTGIARVLRPGGIYAVGLSLADYEHDEPDEDLWEARRGRCRVQQLVQYLPPQAGSRAERVIVHTSVERPSRVEHFDSSYNLRSYDAAEWLDLIGRSPLRLVASANAWGETLDVRTHPYAIDLLALEDGATRTSNR